MPVYGTDTRTKGHTLSPMSSSFSCSSPPITRTHLQVLKHALLRMHEAVSLDSGSTQFSLGGSLFCRRKGSGL